MTALFVAYATPSIDLVWIAPDADVLIVHNDRSLDRERVSHPRLRHLDTGSNVGFGAAVNRALREVRSERVVLCNPDLALARLHWDALVAAEPHETVTVPLVDGDGRPTSVVSRYPTPLAHLASGLRLGRLAPRGTRRRRGFATGLGRWGRAHNASLRSPVGSWPLTTRWASGAALSLDTERLRAVGGFDERYFLYYEDVDLCRRLAAAYPESVVRVADVPAGIHPVGASGGASDAATAHRLDAALRYARRQTGMRWRVTSRILAGRASAAATRA